MLKKLFVYGTLMEDIGSTMSHFLSRNSQLLGKGKIPGQLYDLGNYPGAIYDPAMANWVHGKVFELKHPERVLQQLDYYEGIGIGSVEENEYQRIQCRVKINDQEIDCWMYAYQLPVDSLSLIESGDYSLYQSSTTPLLRTVRNS